jgi:hypothetical protein
MPVPFRELLPQLRFSYLSLSGRLLPCPWRSFRPFATLLLYIMDWILPNGITLWILAERKIRNKMLLGERSNSSLIALHS